MNMKPRLASGIVFAALAIAGCGKSTQSTSLQAEATTSSANVKDAGAAPQFAPTTTGAPLPPSSGASTTAEATTAVTIAAAQAGSVMVTPSGIRLTEMPVNAAIKMHDGKASLQPIAAPSTPAISANDAVAALMKDGYSAQSASANGVIAYFGLFNDTSQGKASPDGASITPTIVNRLAWVLRVHEQTAVSAGPATASKPTPHDFLLVLDATTGSAIIGWEEPTAALPAG